MSDPGYDVTDLAGEQFIAKSGNAGSIQLLGDRGIRVLWARDASADDQRECTAWIARKLDAKVTENVEGTAGIAESHRKYKEWLDKRNAT